MLTGVWVDELRISQLLGAQFFRLMADECTDVATIAELSTFCHWVKNGSLVEHFMEILGWKFSDGNSQMEILGLNKADAESIFSVLIDWLKMKNVQCSVGTNV